MPHTRLPTGDAVQRIFVVERRQVSEDVRAPRRSFEGARRRTRTPLRIGGSDSKHVPRCANGDAAIAVSVCQPSFHPIHALNCRSAPPRLVRIADRPSMRVCWGQTFGDRVCCGQIGSVGVKPSKFGLGGLGLGVCRGSSLRNSHRRGVCRESCRGQAFEIRVGGENAVSRALPIYADQASTVVKPTGTHLTRDSGRSGRRQVSEDARAPRRSFEEAWRRTRTPLRIGGSDSKHVPRCANGAMRLLL
jgi:hypothetical protein